MHGACASKCKSRIIFSWEKCLDSNNNKKDKTIQNNLSQYLWSVARRVIKAGEIFVEFLVFRNIATITDSCSMSDNNWFLFHARAITSINMEFSTSLLISCRALWAYASRISLWMVSNRKLTRLSCWPISAPHSLTSSFMIFTKFPVIWFNLFFKDGTSNIFCLSLRVFFDSSDMKLRNVIIFYRGFP